jgi:hypothetical protein
MPNAAARLDTVGPTAPSTVHPRWLVLHVKSGLEHATKARAQYAFSALSVAIDEGFASKLIEAGHGFPVMSDCEFAEIVEDDEAERVDASLGRIA